MPRVYLENYEMELKKALNFFPKEPHAIFTSVSFLSDELFKLWAAEKACGGVKLIIGQHGGNMGIARISQPLEHQIKIADTFVSWGWKEADKKYLSLT